LIIAFLVLSVVILLASGGLQLFFYIQAQQQAISIQQELIAQNAAKTVGAFIQGKFNSLQTAVELSNPITLSPDALKNMMDGLLGHDPSIRQFALLDTGGHRLAQDSIGSNALSSQFVTQLGSGILTQTSKGQNYISSVYIDKETSEPLVAIAVPVKNVFGDFQGTLVAEVDLKFMWDLVDQLKVGQTGYAYVVDDRGNLIAFGDTSRVLRGEDGRQILAVKEFLQNPAASTGATLGVTTYTGLRGGTVVGTYVPLGTPSWAVITELPWQEAYQPVFRVIEVSAIIILLMAILAGLVGVLVARRLVVPLIDLTKTATRIANGEMQLQAPPNGAREIASLALAVNSMTTQLRELIGSLEQRVSRRTQELERQTLRVRTAAEVARDIASAPNLDELLTRSGQLIVERFEFYHAGIFLLDDKKEYAVLRASPTEAGKQLIANNHRLRVGEQGIVGRVAATGEARIALDTGADAVYFNNPLLPATHSEMALPLKTTEGVLGVLDVQSEQPQAFTQEDIQIIQIMADQLAIAIERTRLQKQVEDQLKEIERTHEEYTRRSWRSFTQIEKRIAGYKFDGVQLYPIDRATDNAKETIEADPNIPPETKSDALKSQAFPIRLRGQVIGFVNVRLHGDNESSETTAIIEQIADRLASTLENARLTEETRQRAQREHAIAEISTKISTYSDVDSIMRSAVEELGNKLGSTTEVTLELVSDNQG
jgi:GAF domain-containing protein/HAMP domain-containing protein